MTHIPSLARARTLQAHIRRDRRVCGYDGGDQRHRSIDRVVRLGASVQVPVADKFGNLRCTRDPHDLGAESRVSFAACFVPGASGLYCKNVASFVDHQQCPRCVGLWPLMHMILTHPSSAAKAISTGNAKMANNYGRPPRRQATGGRPPFPPAGSARRASRVCTLQLSSVYWWIWDFRCDGAACQVRKG